MQRGLSINEVLSMPAWLRQDFSFIVGVIADERDRLRREKAQQEALKKRLNGRKKEQGRKR